MKDAIYLQEWREKAGLTLRSVADRMGVSQTTIHKWEQNQNSPSVRDLFRLAKVYGIPVPSFFMVPNRPKLDEDMLDTVRALAAVAGIHPLAFILIKGDYTRLHEAEELTRLLRAYERLPPELREHWMKIGESYPLPDGTSD